MNVLYLHMVGAFGGASRSLFEAVRAFPQGAVVPHFVTQRGSVEGFFSQLGPVIAARGLSQFDDTRYGHYRRARWLVLLRELAFLPATIAALVKAKRAWGAADLIHVNEVTGLVPLLVARLLFRAPVVVHVRSVMRPQNLSPQSRLVNRILRSADAVVAIDETVRASLPEGMKVDIVHNGLRVANAERVDPSLADLNLRPTSLKVGFVGNLMKVKGILDLIEAARLLRDRGVDVEFIIVGDDARPSRGLKARLLRASGLSQDVRSGVEELLEAYDLRGMVHMVGFRSDIASVYPAFDVLCFPSHYAAPGRPIFEAAFSKVPSIVALSRPRADTLVDGVTGLAIPPHEPESIAAAVAALAGDRDYCRRLGQSAYELAARTFDIEANARRLLDVYRRVLPASGDQQHPQPRR